MENCEMAKKHVAVLLVFILTGLFTAVAYAQDGLIEPVSPQEAVYQAEMAAHKAAYDAAFAAYIDTIAYEDLFVVYLTAPDAPQYDYINDEGIAKHFGAHVVDSWGDFLALTAEQQPDVLFVHGAAAPLVDPAWTQSAYRDGVLFVGLSMPFADMQALTGDICLREPNPGYLRYNPEMMLVMGFQLPVLERAADREAVEQAFLQDCQDPQGLGIYAVKRVVYNSFILGQDWVDWLKMFVRVETASKSFPPFEFYVAGE
jgi:hypothetical protein